MSNTTVTQKRRAIKVAKSSKTLNVSSGVFRANQSITKSINPLYSGKSFSSAGDSKVMEKSLAQTPKHTALVFDENGQDVTPHPLYNPDPGVLQPKQGKIVPAHETSWTTMTDFPSVAFQTNASFTGPFTRSFFGSVSASRTSQRAESVTDETKDLPLKQDLSNSLSDVQTRREEVKEWVREDLLDRTVDCYMTETETIWLLDIPAVSVSVDSEDAKAVKERNIAYTELCKNRQGNDKYVERSMQTFSGAPKTKEVQCETITMADKAVMSTVWDMYDSFSNNSDFSGNIEVSSKGNEAIVPESSPVSHHLDPKSSDQSLSVVSTTSTVSGSSSHVEKMTCVLPVEEEPDLQLILQSDKLKQDLALMERVVLANIFQPKLAAYRQLPIIEDPDSVRMAMEEESWTEQSKSSLCPFLERLWGFSCELTMGRNVSCMSWNKKNPDLLAVGYGQVDLKKKKSGLVCCWSLKNPTWPDRIYYCESGVTALDFSESNANQLAVGMCDGTIAIYNVQTAEQTPITDSSDCANTHTSPVWELRWIDHENGLAGDKGEILVSVSSDGRISKWNHYKSLECIDLMKLKIHNSQWRRRISSLCPGLCFDFHPNDSKIYLVGTEEGQIHKCSSSYNEQYLESYKAHECPVYKVTWSPFCPDVFLSCSSDWTIQLWRQDLQTPVLGFTSGQTIVFDIMWSPHSATVFGVVSEGKVEIWDLRVSSLDPTVVSVMNPGVNPTALLFSPVTDCILVGDSEGQVTVYKLKNITAGGGTQMETLEDVIQSTLSSQH